MGCRHASASGERSEKNEFGAVRDIFKEINIVTRKWNMLYL